MRTAWRKKTQLWIMLLALCAAGAGCSHRQEGSAPGFREVGSPRSLPENAAAYLLANTMMDTTLWQERTELKYGWMNLLGGWRSGRSWKARTTPETDGLRVHHARYMVRRFLPAPLCLMFAHYKWDAYNLRSDASSTRKPRGECTILYPLLVYGSGEIPEGMGGPATFQAYGSPWLGMHVAMEREDSRTMLSLLLLGTGYMRMSHFKDGEVSRLHTALGGALWTSWKRSVSLSSGHGPLWGALGFGRHRGKPVWRVLWFPVPMFDLFGGEQD